MTASAPFALALAAFLAVPCAATPARPGVLEAELRGHIAQLEQRASERPGDAEVRVDLAMEYRSMSRLTGRAEWDEKAAAAVAAALAVSPADPQALTVKAWVQAARHDFEGAVVTASAAAAAAPASPWAWGVLADALTELGRYPEAVAAVEKMMARRPGAAAYSRAAHLRSLHGDAEGAIALMKMAVNATSPSEREQRAWMLVMLGREHQVIGEHDAARRLYRGALHAVPGYHLASYHLADSLAATGEVEEALALLEPLHSINPMATTAAALGDLHAEAGRRERASALYAEVDSTAAAGDPATAEPRWLARFYADQRRKLPEALRMVEAELKTHQDIETWDGLAWALHRAGRNAEALTAVERAGALGTRRARLLYHRGMIEKEAGRGGDARRHLEMALALNDLWPAERRQAEAALRTMTSNGGGR